MKQIITSNDVKKGEIFKAEGETWICTGNNGFIFTADNVNPNAITANIMWIGGSYDVEVDR